MSVSHKLLDSKLKLPDVLNTFKAIGVESEYKGEDDDGEKTYVIGNDTYGYTRMYSKKDIVTEFHRFGFGKAPIGMLFHCFSFIAYDTNDYGCDEFDVDIANLPPREFFAKHYPVESEVYETELIRAKEFEEDHPDLHAYITSLGRTLNSYRFEYAYVNQVPVGEVTNVDDVIQFMSQTLIDSENMGDMSCTR